MCRYLSMDIETTGLSPETCDIIEIGAVVDDLSKNFDVDKLPRFHCYIQKLNYKGEPYTFSLHSEIFKRIHNLTPPYNYVTERNVVGFLSKFIFEHFGYNTVTVAGKNFSSFDRKFLEKLPEFNTIKLHYRVIDPSILFFDPKIDKELPATKLCMERAGIKGEVAHTAVEDAIVVCKLVRAGLNV
jgi:oligoribonuclease (3'-5' exoribonuclease)